MEAATIAIGDRLLPIVNDFANNVLIPFLDWLVTSGIPGFEAFIRDGIELLAPAFDFAREAIDWFVEHVQPRLEWFNEMGRQAIQYFKEYLGGFITFLRGVFTGDWDLAWKGLSQMAEAWMNIMRISIGVALINIVELFALGLEGITGMMGITTHSLTTLWDDFLDKWESGTLLSAESIIELFGKAVQAIIDNIQILGQVLGPVAGAVLGTISNIPALKDKIKYTLRGVLPSQAEAAAEAGAGAPKAEARKSLKDTWVAALKEAFGLKLPGTLAGGAAGPGLPGYGNQYVPPGTVGATDPFTFGAGGPAGEGRPGGATAGGRGKSAAQLASEAAKKHLADLLKSITGGAMESLEGLARGHLLGEYGVSSFKDRLSMQFRTMFPNETMDVINELVRAFYSEIMQGAGYANFREHARREKEGMGEAKKAAKEMADNHAESLLESLSSSAIGSLKGLARKHLMGDFTGASFRDKLAIEFKSLFSGETSTVINELVRSFARTITGGSQYASFREQARKDKKEREEAEREAKEREREAEQADRQALSGTGTEAVTGTTRPSSTGAGDSFTTETGNIFHVTIERIIASTLDEGRAAARGLKAKCACCCKIRANG